MYQMKNRAVILFLFSLLKASSAFSPAPRSFRQTKSRVNNILSTAANDEENGNASTITVALTQALGKNEEILAALNGHAVLPMLGVTLDSLEVPCVNDNSEIDSFDSLLAKTDIAFFGSSGAVNTWLHNVDLSLGIEGMEDEERQKMGNGDVVAVCISKDTANTCLQSKRWESRNIYYPQGGGPTSIEDWADAAAQAFGDCMERKFWGGGW